MKLTIQHGSKQFHIYDKDICLDQPKPLLEVALEQYTFLVYLHNK